MAELILKLRQSLESGGCAAVLCRCGHLRLGKDDGADNDKSLVHGSSVIKLALE